MKLPKSQQTNVVFQSYPLDPNHMDRHTSLNHEQLITLLEIASELITISDITFDQFADVVLILLEDIPGIDDESERQEIVQLLWSINNQT